jgi:hypothetical protein
MKLLAKNLNLKLTWELSSALPALYANKLIPTKYFPNFNVDIYDKENNLLQSFKNIDSKKEIEKYIVPNEILYPPKESIEGTRIQKDLQSEKNIQKVLENYFEYPFLSNYKKYKQIKNKIGFFDNLKFDITFNSKEPSYLNFEVEYPKLNTLKIDSIFNKIYRSNDYYSIKFLINTENWNESQAYSLLIFPSYKDTKLNKILVENVSSLWLNSIDELKLLTVPFVETGLVENLNSLDLKIYVLNKIQLDLYKFLGDFEFPEDIENFFSSTYSDQIINVSLDQNNNKNGFFQGSLYSFNDENFNALSWPKNELLINNLNYKNYFPISNYNSKDTILIEEQAIINNVLSIFNSQDMESNQIGLYYNNIYESCTQDIPFFNFLNLNSLEIVEVRNLNGNIQIFLEATTNIENIENIYIESSSNLILQNKYLKNINGKAYTAILFLYEYSKSEVTNKSLENNLQVDQIIYKKAPISFSWKIVN